MPAVTVFGGLFCGADSVVKEVAKITGYRVVTDVDVIDEAARLSGIEQETILNYFPTGSGDSESRRNRVFSALRFAMAKMAADGQNLIFWGYMALLPPTRIENLLGVCLISDMNARIATACEAKGCNEAEARELIRANDQVRSDLALAVTDCNDPWDKRLYDLRIPVAATGIKQSALLIAGQIANTEQQAMRYRKSTEDFLLEANVQAALAHEGQDVSVSARKGSLTLYFNDCRSVLRTMSRQLAKAASGFHGVEEVEIGVGRQYNHNDMYALVPRRTVSAPAPANSALAAEIQRSLQNDGLDVSVRTQEGRVTLKINSHRQMLHHLSRRLCDFAAAFDGVSDVSTGLGREYHQVDGHMKTRRSLARSFVADDKRQFALALSDRLDRRADAGSFTFRNTTATTQAPRKAIRVAPSANRAYLR